MSTKFLLSLLVGLTVWPSSFVAYNYCYGGEEENLCKKNVHIVCDPKDVPMDGELTQLLPMSSHIRELILKHHNDFRDKMASGNEKTATVSFPAAARMVELTWDDELAFTARVHAARCNMEHDKCHNTRRFPYSGQNLAFTTNTRDSLQNNLVNLMTMWYDEKEKVTSVDDMAKYTSAAGQLIGHLTCMVCERSSRVGCAIASCKKGPKTNLHMTCNYENTNVNGLPVYTSADSAASKCADWKSKVSEKFPHLCENTGTLLDTTDLMKPGKGGGGGGGGGAGGGAAGGGGDGGGGEPPADPALRGMGLLHEDGHIRHPNHPQYPKVYTVLPDIDMLPMTSKDEDIHD